MQCLKLEAALSHQRIAGQYALEHGQARGVVPKLALAILERYGVRTIGHGDVRAELSNLRHLVGGKDHRRLATSRLDLIAQRRRLYDPMDSATHGTRERRAGQLFTSPLPRR